jgi:phenylalanyl-tRNA synthetase alpha chain
MENKDKKGTEHPLSILAEQAYGVFSELGFEIALGPELESEWYNFDALNVSKDHPARDMQDTFWIKGDSKIQENFRKVLRTHATSVTSRMLEISAKEGRMPAAFISIGKVFRNEATDATHEMQFYHVDGVMVGNIEDGVSLANLKGILTHFYKKMLGDDVEMEFRPSFFPFVEPGLEVWLKFKNRWLEVMGAGMLHPNVLRNLGLDPEKVQGFAFGGGLDRIAMVKWGIPDVRLFYQGDLRLNQF